MKDSHLVMEKKSDYKWQKLENYEGEGELICSYSFTLVTTRRIETYQIATYSIRTLLKMDY
jgi:hypothetical protein